MFDVRWGCDEMRVWRVTKLMMHSEVLVERVLGLVRVRCLKVKCGWVCMLYM